MKRNEGDSNEIMLVPREGLGNRMRAIASTWLLARQLGRQLTVVWMRDKGLNARFSDLFELPHGVEGLRVVEGGWRERLLYAPSRLCNLHLPGLLRKWGFALSFNEHEREDGVRRLLRGTSGRVFITSYSIIGNPSEEEMRQAALRLFYPSAPVRTIVEEHSAGFTPRMIGVHIRRTDNARSISESPTSLFIRMLEAERRSAACSIFLASDSADEKQALLEHFPDLITDSYPTARNSTAGVQHALADMLLLARCQTIYGSFYSSFSEFAALMGKGRLLVVKRNSGD